MHLTVLWRCTHSPHSSLPMFMCAKCRCVASESYQKIAQYTLTDGDSYTVTALRIIHRFGRDLMDLDLAPSLHFCLTFGGCLVWDFWTCQWGCECSLQPEDQKKQSLSHLSLLLTRSLSFSGIFKLSEKPTNMIIFLGSPS